MRGRSIAWLLLPLVLGCGKRSNDAAREQTPKTITSPARPDTIAPREPGERHPLDFSAYSATLLAHGESVYVLTSHEVSWVTPGKPLERRSADLGETPAIASNGIVYWVDGELRRASEDSGSSEVLAVLPRRPRRLQASAERVVWEEAGDDEVRIRTLVGSEPRSIFQAGGSIEALALMDDQVYFVHRKGDEWRLGNVAIEGGTPRYGEPRASRAPAQLVAARDVFFYDGPTSTLRRVTSDLSREEAIARDLICSPLAVAKQVYCAQVSFLFTFAPEGGRPRLLVPKRPGTIAALVATRTRVAWLLETGENSSVLEVLEL